MGNIFHLRFVRLAQGMLLASVLAIFATNAQADNKTYHVHVNGLACPFCVYGLERSLDKVDGVEMVAVSLKTGLIRITMQEGVTLDETETRETIKDAGFTVESFAVAEPISGESADDGA